MKKVKLTLEAQEAGSIEYNGKSIEVKSYMGIAQQGILIEKYVEEYFSDNPERLIKASEYNYLEAEYNLMDYILQTCTNIDTKDLDEDVYANSDLFDRVAGVIWNYGAFKERLYKVVQEVKEQKAMDKSAGKIIEDLAEKANALLTEFGKLDPKEISKLQDTGKELIDELKKNSLVQ